MRPTYRHVVGKLKFRGRTRPILWSIRPDEFLRDHTKPARHPILFCMPQYFSLVVACFSQPLPLSVAAVPGASMAGPLQSTYHYPLRLMIIPSPPRTTAPACRMSRVLFAPFFRVARGPSNEVRH